MSLLRVHNFAISLDGFGTGEGQSRGLHFGRGGDRLHQCMFRRQMVGPQESGRAVPDGECRSTIRAMIQRRRAGDCGAVLGARGAATVGVRLATAELTSY